MFHIVHPCCEILSSESLNSCHDVPIRLLIALHQPRLHIQQLVLSLSKPLNSLLQKSLQHQTGSCLDQAWQQASCGTLLCSMLQRSQTFVNIPLLGNDFWAMRRINSPRLSLAASGTGRLQTTQKMAHNERALSNSHDASLLQVQELTTQRADST